MKVIVGAASPWHNVTVPVIVAVGSGLIVTSTASVFTQLFASVPVAVYVTVPTPGVNGTPFVTPATSQTLVDAPVAFKVIASPSHAI